MSENLPEKREENGLVRDAKGRFIKGRPHPKGGRPKGSYSLVTIWKRKLAEDPARAERLAEAILTHAEEGNGTAIKQVLDRLDGPVTEKTEGTQKIIVEYERPDAD